MEIESVDGGENIPGISSSNLITLIVAEPLFSIVIVVSISELTYVLILERSNFFSISASRTVSFCSLTDISPLDSEDALGRIEYERVGNVNLGWSSDLTVFTIESQLPSGGNTILKSEESNIGSSLPAKTTVISESVTTNDDLFSKTNLLCQIPGRSSSVGVTKGAALLLAEIFSKFTLDTVLSAEYVAVTFPAGILFTSFVVTIGDNSKVWLCPTDSLPTDHVISDPSTEYSDPSGISKLSGNVLITSIPERLTVEIFSILMITEISCGSSEWTNERLAS